jgi:hypothetical protein
MRELARRVLPEKVLNFLRTAITASRTKRLQGLSLPEAFDEVYRKKMWKQGDSLSGLGSEGELAGQYLSFLESYIDTHNIKSIGDAGCGDFAIGSRICGRVESYIGLDVSGFIIERNKRAFGNLKNVSFAQCDLTDTIFPETDLVCIRQVLQHLTNAQIALILANLQKSPGWRRVLITEDVSDPLDDSRANADLAAHTVDTRVNHGGGVFIDRPPFNIAARRVKSIQAPTGSRGGVTHLLIFEIAR